MSAAHIDWHEKPFIRSASLCLLDDASRMIIAGGEYAHCNTENTIKVLNGLIRDYWDICPLRKSRTMEVNLELTGLIKMVHGTVSLKGELENLELNQYLQRSDILRQTEN